MATENVKLNAVNSILRAIGGSPITSLDSPENLQGGVAINALDDTKRQVFLETLWKSVVNRMTLSPVGETQELIVQQPNRTLAVYAVNPDQDNLSLRGNRLYNHENDSYTWDRSVDVYVVENVAFSILSGVLQDYITALTKYYLYMDRIGGNMADHYRAEMYRAKTRAKREDAIYRNPNFIYDSSTSRRIAQRGMGDIVDIRQYNAHLDPSRNPLNNV